MSNIRKALSKVLFSFLQFRSFITSCFFHTISCIFSSLFEVLLCWYCFWFGISTNNFLSFLFGFWRQFRSLLTNSLFSLLSSLFQGLLCLLSLSLNIGSSYFTYFISNFVKNVTGSFFNVLPSLGSCVLNIFHGSFMRLHSYSFFNLLFSFF